MTWQIVGTCAAVFLACFAFAVPAALWLSWATDRTNSFWPLAVVVVAAFGFALGLTAAIMAWAPIGGQPVPCVVVEGV